MKNDGALACTEREASFHLPMHQGGVEEPQTADKGGFVGYFGEGHLGLQGTDGSHDIVQIYGKGADIGGQLLEGSERQPEEG